MLPQKGFLSQLRPLQLHPPRQLHARLRLRALLQRSHCPAVLPLQEVNEAFDELEEGNEEALKTEYDRQVGGGVLKGGEGEVDSAAAYAASVLCLSGLLVSRASVLPGVACWRPARCWLLTFLAAESQAKCLCWLFCCFFLLHRSLSSAG